MSRADSTARRLTVLTTLGINAVKTYSLDDKGKISVEGYGRAKTFTASEIEVDDRGKWLEKLRHKSESFVVLGAPKDWKRGEKKRRLSSSRDGADATIIDVPRLWMPVDVDQVDFDPVAEIDDGDVFARELLDRLKIRGVHCVWHLTNSHGFFDKHRARLWLKLETPALASEMKEFARARWGDDTVEVNGKEKRIVDLSVYQCQQPIYTGDPILLDGIEDPVTRRVGFISGKPMKLRVAKSKRKAKGAPEDENISKLEAAGLYIGRLKPGQHMIHCPWEDMHSGDERDDDTFYFEPHHNGHDIPAYKCHHASCEEKRWSDVAAFIGGPLPPETNETRESFSKVEGAKEKSAQPRWVYIVRLNKFRDPRDGALIDRESYDALIGGKTKQGTPTDLFIRDPKKEKVDRAEFRPDMAGVLTFVDERGVKVVNTYVDRRAQPGENVDPKIVNAIREHIEWMIPDEDERRHLLGFMAWAYLNPGSKVLWAVVLFGPGGEGKTTIFDAFCRLVGHYSAPTTKDLRKSFDTFAHEKLVVRIEELKCEEHFEIVERMKPIIANDTIDIELKYENTKTARNFANVVASTNHADALPLGQEDRRWCLISTVNDAAQIRKRQPVIKALKDMLDTRDGLRAFAAMLKAHDLSEFRPKGHAPETSLKREVAVASMTKPKRAALHMKEDLSDEPVVTTSMVHEVLQRHGLSDYDTRRYGLIAKQLGWLAFNDGGENNRLRCGGDRDTEAVWATTGKRADLDDFEAMSIDERRAYVSERMSRLTGFSEQDDDLIRAPERAGNVVSLRAWIKARRGRK